MASVKADLEHNRLDITSDVPLHPEESSVLLEQISAEAQLLRPGWVAAVDFRGMRVESSFVNEQFRLLQEALLAKGASRIGTLLDSDPLMMRLWQSGSQTRSNEITQRFYDEAKWEAFLAGP